MNNYSCLWIRMIWIFIVCVIGMIVIFLIRDRMGKISKCACGILVIALLIFGVGSGIYSMANPRVKSIVGEYQGSVRRNGMFPFEYEYCFVEKGKKHHIEMDAFSKRRIYPDELVVGNTYTINYEEKQNIILYIGQ